MQIFEIGKVQIDSLKLSKMTGKEHYNVIKDIRSEFKELIKLGCSEEKSKNTSPNISDYITFGTYISEQNKKLVKVNLTEKGLLVMGARYSHEVRRQLVDLVYDQKEQIINYQKEILNMHQSHIFNSVSNKAKYCGMLSGKQRKINKLVKGGIEELKDILTTEDVFNLLEQKGMF